MTYRKKPKKSFLFAHLVRRFPWLLVGILGFFIGYQWHDYHHYPALPIEGNQIEVYFSPRGGCTEAVVRAIDKAEASIYVYAYSFTSAPIAEALIKAKKRGVDVHVLADKSQSRGRGCRLSLLQEANIPIWIDRVSCYAHNKVMVIDERLSITGSMNWSKNGEYYNAENIVLIDHREVAQRYKENWLQRVKKAYQYTW